MLEDGVKGPPPTDAEGVFGPLDMSGCGVVGPGILKKKIVNIQHPQLDDF